MAPFIATFLSPVMRVQMTQKGEGGSIVKFKKNSQISTQKGLDAKREFFEEYFIKKTKDCGKLDVYF